MWFNEKTFARVITIILMIVIVLCAVMPAVCAKEPDVPLEIPVERPKWTEGIDYLSLMEIVLEECGDDGIPVARLLEEKRNQKIVDTKSDFDKTSFCFPTTDAKSALKRINSYKLLRNHVFNQHDLSTLAALIWVEAGDDTLSEDWKFCVGEVALNRVLSDDFPNTLQDVVSQPGQYDRSWTYAYQKPSAVCFEIAQELLEGERRMEPDVVFQSGIVQGSGIYKTFYSPIYGTTYLCYSSNRKDQ